MKCLILVLILLNFSCQKEEKLKDKPTPVAAPFKAPSVKHFYCGYFAHGCEDYAEDSVYVDIEDEKKIRVARRFSEAESPFSWGFSGEYDKSKTTFLLKSDPIFSNKVDGIASGAASNLGKYDEPLKVIFNCEEDLRNCRITGSPSETPGSAFESAMLSFELKCNDVALTDQSVKDCQ